MCLNITQIKWFDGKKMDEMYRAVLSNGTVSNEMCNQALDM